ncbi:tetratricopeptide repeat protein [candidate division KSB1 bacterium]|nr:tetratricopeptide repeat protein [candidate division KSB1 bacterium]
MYKCQREIKSYRLKYRYFIFVLISLVLFGSCKNLYYQNATFNIEQHEWEKARTELDKLIQQNPDDAKAFFMLGDVYAHLDQYEKMHTCFSRCLELSNRFQNQINHLIQKHWVENFNAGIKRFDEGKHDKAILRFINATIIKPNKPIAYIHLGNIYRIQAKFDNAIDIYMKAIRLNKKDVISRNHLAAIYFEKKEYHNAIQMCHEIVKIDSKNAEAIQQLARCYELLNEMDNAIKWYREASRLLPQNKTIHTNLGVAFFTSQDFEKSIKEFKTALSIDSLDTTLYHYLGECYWALRDYPSMVTCFEHIIDIDPWNLAAWRNLTVGYNHLGRYAESDSARVRLEALQQTHP